MSSADTEYDPFERLVDIEIEGISFAVPENNIVLRCVQFILDDDMVLGRFCWNNECGNCEAHLPNARPAGAPASSWMSNRRPRRNGSFRAHPRSEILAPRKTEVARICLIPKESKH